MYWFPDYEEKYVDGKCTEKIKYYSGPEGVFAQTKTELKDKAWEEKTEYLYKDILGSTVKVFGDAASDGKIETVETAFYEPFGKQSVDGKEETNRGFTGHFTEDDDLIYCHARWYDSSLGRFIQADSVLDGFNRYAYCGNNPICYTDPSGNSICGKVLGYSCYVGSAVVIAAGTAIVSTTAGTSAFIVAPVAAEIAGKLFAIGTATLIADGVVEAAKNIPQNTSGQGYSAQNDDRQDAAAQETAQMNSAASASPDPDNNKKNDDKQSAKDAKKLDNKGADKLAQDKGYKDAHELKKDYVKGLKDKKVDHYNLYKNSKTGESFMIHNESQLAIPLE